MTEEHKCFYDLTEFPEDSMPLVVCSVCGKKKEMPTYDPSKREELIQIIEKFDTGFVSPEKNSWLDYKQGLSDAILEWHKKTALSWFKEQLPKKKEEKIQNNAYLEGAEYNQCLQDTLTNLEEKK
jgi:hypothetical protein